MSQRDLQSLLVFQRKVHEDFRRTLYNGSFIGDEVMSLLSVQTRLIATSMFPRVALE